MKSAWLDIQTRITYVVVVVVSKYAGGISILVEEVVWVVVVVLKFISIEEST